MGTAIYVEQCGNPDGIPVMVLHGGPGGGCAPAMRRYFDPARLPRHPVRPARLRPVAAPCQRAWPTRPGIWSRISRRSAQTLGIDRLIAFGGSWGATLALIYAITHPDRVAHLVLRGVFLMTQAELTWFYGGGAGAFFPDIWARFVDAIPEDERGDLIAAYHRRLFSGNLMEETPLRPDLGELGKRAGLDPPRRRRWGKARRNMPAPSPGWKTTTSRTRASWNATAGSCRNATGSSISRPPSCRAAMT